LKKNFDTLNDIMREAYGAGPDSPVTRLLRVIIDMETRIESLEATRMPVFSGIPPCPFTGTPVLHGGGYSGAEKEIYQYLLEAGFSGEESAAAAREIGDISE
jgi:hypothetical protein